MNHVLGCSAVGIEYNPSLYQDALDNLRNYAGRTADGRVRFLCENAEYYDPLDANRFYFFNPFSEKLLRAVIRRIVNACFDAPREMYLFFYYAPDPCRCMLMREEYLEFVEEISCRDLFHNDDPLESILVFRVTGCL